jgi:hypothetical protein
VNADIGGHRVRAFPVHRQEQGQRGAEIPVPVGIQDQVAIPAQPPGRVGDLEVRGGVRDRREQRRQLRDSFRCQDRARIATGGEPLDPRPHQCEQTLPLHSGNATRQQKTRRWTAAPQCRHLAGRCARGISHLAFSPCWSYLSRHGRNAPFIHHLELITIVRLVEELVCPKTGTS